MKEIIAFIFPLVFSQILIAKCLDQKGALDIGSGTTKAIVLQVDVCQKKILKVLFDSKVPMAFKESLQQSTDNRFPESTFTEATAKISSLIAEMKKMKPSSLNAVATSAFRTAKDGDEFARKLEKSLKISIKIISQEEEASLGALSAISQVSQANSEDSRPIAVWDIGGGSQQMWSQASSTKAPQIFQGDLAAVSFKSHVIKEIQKKDPSQTSSPNPLWPNTEKAILWAQQHAHKNVPPFFIENAQKLRWLGIGGVLSASVQDQVGPGKTIFRLPDLEKTLQINSKLSDSAIPGDYKDTQVTNLALVAGYMKALKISQVETLNVSLAQGFIYQQLQTSSQE